MFFTFIKMCIVYLLFRFILTDGFNLITSIMGLSCDEDDSAICGNGFFQKTSIYNKRNVEASNNIKIVIQVC